MSGRGHRQEEATVAGCRQQEGAGLGDRGEMKAGPAREGFDPERAGTPPLQGSQRGSKGVIC